MWQWEVRGVAMGGRGVAMGGKGCGNGRQGVWQWEVRGVTICVAVRREERWTFSWTNTPVVGLAKWRHYFVFLQSQT